MDEREIVRAVKAGDNVAFEKIFQKYAQTIFFTAMGLVNNRVIAEGAVQEVFLYLWEHRKHLDENRSIAGYLNTSVRHYILNYLRHKKIEKIHEEHVVREYLFWDEEGEDITYWIEEVRRQVNNLPNACRNIFIMAVIDGMSYVKTAQELNISVNTVKSQVKIAYRKLKEGLNNMSRMDIFLFIFLIKGHFDKF